MYVFHRYAATKALIDINRSQHKRVLYLDVIVIVDDGDNLLTVDMS